MLSVLVLCALLHSLQGASVPPPPHPTGSVASANILGIEACECPACPDNGVQRLRTVYSIVQSCLVTIFACVWKSIHPNIDGPRDSGWTCLKRRLVTMLCALIAPELVLLWALNQRASAQEIADKYNKEFARLEKTETPSMWGKIVGWFQPLPKYTTKRGSGQPWTITHGFLIQMGGFLLYENEYPKEVLDFKNLTQLIRDKAIDAPTVSESDIQDRSKGDAISKAIVLLQTLSFVVQCIARAAQRLPLSELEVLTLAFAVMNAAIYWAWWDKPQAVGKGISVSLNRAEKAVDDSAIPMTDAEAHGNSSDSNPANLPGHQHSNDTLPLIPLHEQQPDDLESIAHSPNWLHRMLRKDRERHDSPFFFLISLPFRIVAAVFHYLCKIGGESDNFDVKQLRVPMFYTKNTNSSGAMASFLIIGVIFGAIHLLAWASEFPSSHDRVLWRVSVIVLIVEPLLAPLCLILDSLGAEMFSSCCVVLITFGLPLYVAARGILIVTAFKAILHPPHNVLVDIAWTQYIPHF